MGQNITLKLEAQAGSSILEVHTTKPTTWKAKGKWYVSKGEKSLNSQLLFCSCEITMGDLQSEEERDVLLELKLPAVPSPISQEALKGQLKYFNVVTSSLDTVEFSMIFERNSKRER